MPCASTNTTTIFALLLAAPWLPACDAGDDQGSDSTGTHDPGDDHGDDEHTGSDDGDGDTSGDGSDQTGDTDSGGTDGGGADTGTGGGTEVGVCGQRGEGMVTVDTYQATEEFYLIAEEGFGEDICVVEYEVERSADAPGGCEDCLWMHTVEYGNPSVLVDENGACADSELGLDEESIAEKVGSEVSYGYVFEYQGHNSVVMRYEDGEWAAYGSANWDEETGDFFFDNRKGFCNY